MFRFTIRDLLWRMVVVAFAVLWRMEMRERYRENSLDLRQENDQLRRELSQAEIAANSHRKFIQLLKEMNEQDRQAILQQIRTRPMTQAID